MDTEIVPSVVKFIKDIESFSGDVVYTVQYADVDGEAYTTIHFTDMSEDRHGTTMSILMRQDESVKLCRTLAKYFSAQDIPVPEVMHYIYAERNKVSGEDDRKLTILMNMYNEMSESDQPKQAFLKAMHNAFQNKSYKELGDLLDIISEHRLQGQKVLWG